MFSLPSRCRSLTLLALYVLLGLAPSLRAGAARDELLRFVPPDIGFCLIVQDLRSHCAALSASPFAKQLRQSPLGQALAASEDVQKALKVEKTLHKQFGIDLTTLRDEVLGDAVVLAYKPGPPGKPELEEGILLVRARNAKALDDLIERFNELQKKAGTLKAIEEREHNGVKYYRRVDIRDTAFYFRRGPVLAFTSQESMLRQALDHERAAPALGDVLLARQLGRLGVESSFLTLYVNPRAFDAGVDFRTAQARAEEAAIHRTAASYWKALEALALSIDLDRDFAVNLAVRADRKKLPAPVQRLLEEAARPSALWSIFPEQPLVAWAGRFDLAALAAALGDLLPFERRKSFHQDLNRTLAAFRGRDFVKDVLPQLGPDFGFCLVAPPGQDRSWPPQGLFAFRVGRGDEAAPVDQTVLSACQFVAQLAILGHNHQQPRKPIVLQDADLDGRKVHFLVGDDVFPPGIRPAFCLHKGFFYVATAPEMIRRFSGPATAPAQPADSPVPLLRISCMSWRTYLQERRADLVRTMTARNDMSSDQAVIKLDRLAAVLQFLDLVEVRQRSSDDQVIFSLVVKPAQPLKK